MRDLDLRSEFLAARISAFSTSPDPYYIRQAVDHARANCLLLLISYNKHDQSVIEQFEALPLTKSPSKALTKAGGHCSGRSRSPRFHSLSATFSVSALFLLAKNVVARIYKRRPTRR